ncbi:hypothetical protein MKX03_032946 [Papaver bracteatum]|nr:hypothetical protein MKX03_032946 [Papaver bracteatum]
MMMITSSKLKCASLILSMVILALLVSECSCQRTRWDNIHTSVANDMSGGGELKIHCKSKDDDLGEHRLTYGAEFAWKFKTNIWETTMFWCNMWVNDVYKGGYHIFEAERDWIRCQNECHYYARNDGLYGFIRKMNDTELVYRWPN